MILKTDLHKKVVFVAFVAFFFVFVINTQATFAQCIVPHFQVISRTQIPDGYVYPYGYDIYGVKDFNGDGKPDVASFNRTNGNFDVMINNGAGSFDNIVTTSFGISNHPYTTGDLNNDGKLDVITGTGTSLPYTFSTFLNDGNGHFTLWNTTTFSSGVNINTGFALIALVDGDNRPDFVTNGYYFPLNADGTFAPAVSMPTGQVFADFNGDGKIDTASANSNSNGLVTLNINNGAGVFNATTFTSQTSNLYQVADLNNDGKPDIIGRRDHYYPYKPTTLINNGAGGFVETLYDIPGWLGDSYGMVTGDFNGDGKTDLLTYPTYSDAPSQYIIFYNDGSGSLTSTTINERAQVAYQYLADFDGDGKTDFLNYPHNQAYYFPQRYLKIKKNVCNAVGQTRYVDFDGDGQSDFVVWRPSDGRWTVRNTRFGAVTQFNWGLGSLGDIPIVGDFDGDGKSDATVFRNSNGTWFVRRSSDSSLLAFQFGQTGDKPVSGDFDGDGKTDFAVYRPANGGWYVWKSSNNQFFAIQFGVAEDKPVPADYDGDGKTDVAVYRPSSGIWYILQSSNGAFVAKQWGNGDDKPVPGDYDQDGKIDLAVFRPSNGNWYLISSYDNSYLPYSFGLSDDVPISGNFNDTDSDLIAVYRPSVTGWYIADNLGGFSDTGEAGEIPVTILP